MDDHFDGPIQEVMDLVHEKIFDDTRVSQTETWDALEAVKDELSLLQAALDDAEQNRG
jgi:hypothetical protein